MKKFGNLENSAKLSCGVVFRRTPGGALLTPFQRPFLLSLRLLPLILMPRESDLVVVSLATAALRVDQSRRFVISSIHSSSFFCLVKTFEFVCF